MSFAPRRKDAKSDVFAPLAPLRLCVSHPLPQVFEKLPTTLLAGLLAIALPPGTVEFRCERMEVGHDERTTICSEHVVLRKGDLIMCCDELRAYATEKWEWQRFECLKHVRAARPGEIFLGDLAHYDVALGAVTLTGAPRLWRGKSWISGEQIDVNLANDRAVVKKPKGAVAAAPDTLATPDAPMPPALVDPSQPLPARCPIVMK